MRANLLSDDTLRRVQELIARDGGVTAPEDQPTGRLRGRTPVLVRCTSATAAGGSGVDAECYPGIIIDPRTSATSPQAELGTVWLTVLGSGGNDEQPSSDTVYPCLLAGRLDIGGDERLRAFAANIGAGPSSGEASFGTFYSITADDTWEDTNFTITLPSSGTYLVIARLNANCSWSAKTASNAFVYARLYDETAAQGFDDTSCVAASSVVANQGMSSMVTINRLITVSQQTVIRIEGRRNSNVTWTEAGIGGQFTATDDWVYLSYIKLA